MKQKTIIYKAVLLLFAVLLSLPVKSELRSVNILSEEYFGFEAGIKGWYFWNTNDFWNIVTDKPSKGNYSMRFSNPDMSTQTVSNKAQVGSDSDAGSFFEVKAGTYNLTLKVYLEPGTTINSFQFLVKDPWIVFDFDISSLNKGEWVTLSKELTFNADVKSVWQLVMPATENGGGTFYIDEISILQEVEFPDVVPAFSFIESTDETKTELLHGQYTISLKVWKDTESTTKSFYTDLQDAEQSLYWDISEIATTTWVTLEQQLTLTKDSKTSVQIRIPNIPEYGGGTGTFYVDELNISASSFVKQQSKPVAIANGELNIKEMESFMLDGTKSYDLEGDNLTYEWIVPDGFTIDDATIAKPTITAPDLTKSASYTVVLRVNDGYVDSEEEQVVVNVNVDTSVLDYLSFKIGIFPNPANSIVNITGVDEIRSVAIISLDGTISLIKQVNGSKDVIDISKMTEGIYFIKLITNNGDSISKKLLIN